MTPLDGRLNKIILKYAVLAGVADITPIVGADIAAVAGCQLKMFYEMAEEYSVGVTQERFTEVLTTLAAGVGGWALTIFGATTMLKVVPGISSILLYWQPPAIAAFTWAMGQVLKSYFPLIKQGRTWDKAEMRTAMSEAWAKAKDINWAKELKNSVRFTV
jgi:uncharacterized protein (DUF697 family)